MSWQIIHVDFSIFQTDEWKTVYCQGEKNKLILLSYQSADLIAVCMISKKGYRIDGMSPFMPTFLCSQEDPINPISSFIYDEFADPKVVTLSKKELKFFKLTQKQVISNVLIKSYNEQASNYYLQHNFDFEAAEFFFIKKDKEKYLASYLKFMDDKGISLVRKYCGIGYTELANQHNRILFSNDLSVIKEFIKASQNAFSFSMLMCFNCKNIDALNYQYNFLYSNINELMKESKIIDPLYQCIHFYEPIFLFQDKLVVSIVDSQHLINNHGKPIGYYYEELTYAVKYRHFNLGDFHYAT